jgi:PTH1 family peptidyl-tRNA hydrolase
MLDMLREELWGSEWQDSKFHGVVSKLDGARITNHESRITSSDILLFKPTTYMNLSGDAVSTLVNFYKLDPQTDVLVISDDIDMEFGKVRYRAKGSHGGQNGLKDIIAKLGTDEFARIKIGIGRHEQYSVSDWVLSKFTGEELDILRDEVFLKVKDAVFNTKI